jgi:excisionase family DNA binding protein
MERIPESSTDQLMSPKEISQLCGLSARTVYRTIARGELPAAKLCGRLRARMVDVEQWIERNMVEAVSGESHTRRDDVSVHFTRGSLRAMLRSTNDQDGGAR